MLSVYRIPFSTNVERVALALAHKGIEVEWIDVDPDDRSAVVAVSGQELVPVLVDGDLVLPDSTAILEYLEERFPEPPLYPADPARRAELRVFVDWFNRSGSGRRTRSSTRRRSREPDRDPDRRAHERIADALPVFEALLTGRDFLFGDG